jgi:hypothetical protein
VRILLEQAAELGGHLGNGFGIEREFAIGADPLHEVELPELGVGLRVVVPGVSPRLSWRTMAPLVTRRDTVSMAG